MHGYQIIQELSTRSDGHWRPSPGSVYPTLQLLEDEGLVASEEADGKRVYKLTAAGVEQAKAAENAPAPWEELAEGGAGSGRWQLHQGMGKLAAAIMQAGSSASDEQVDRVLEILTDARKKIYGILAED
jgi:DNA-binding PadR family transcriptional regulator